MKLPKGYTLLDYIESTGTQYVDSLYSAPNGFIFDCEFSWTNIGGSYIVGSYNKEAPYGRNGVGLAGGKNFWELGTGDVPVQASGHTVTLGTKYKVQGSTVKGNSYLNIDGTRILNSSDSVDRHPETLLVFYIHYGKHFGDNTALGKLYYLKISDPNGVLVRHFVPCKNASGEIGLYDLVEGKFYGNEGSGTFVAGNVIAVFTGSSGKTLIDGTAYDVIGGKTLVNGTAYSIQKGKVLVNGAVYEIGVDASNELCVILDLGTIGTYVTAMQSIYFYADLVELPANYEDCTHVIVDGVPYRLVKSPTQYTNELRFDTINTSVVETVRFTTWSSPRLYIYFKAEGTYTVQLAIQT